MLFGKLLFVSNECKKISKTPTPSSVHQYADIADFFNLNEHQIDSNTINQIKKRHNVEPIDAPKIHSENVANIKGD